MSGQEFESNTEAKLKPNYALQEPPLFRFVMRIF